VIGPLVQGPRDEGRAARNALLALTAGALVGSIILGVALEGVALALPRAGQHATRLIFVSGAAMILLADVASRGRFSPLSWRRQTCAAWIHSRRYVVAPLAWGFDLGLGFSTFRISGIYWIGIAGCVLYSSTARIPMVMTGYAIGFSSAIALSVLVLRSRSTYTTSSLIDWSRRVRYGLAIATVLLIAAAVLG
jgi:hypothetical protein